LELGTFEKGHDSGWGRSLKKGRPLAVRETQSLRNQKSKDAGTAGSAYYFARQNRWNSPRRKHFDHSPTRI